ncbi:MAG: hypothetical protein HUU20_21395 [Pirellulales bacterium]|nr:hypothetical protein [Pirellulales bacterium]
MPIEFRCTGCNRLLRTADDTAGKQAKCPECGAVQSVPEMAGAPPPPPPHSSPFAGEPQSQPEEPENPYRSPDHAGQLPPVPAAGLDAYALARVTAPAIALIVTGALGAGLKVLSLLVMAFQFNAFPIGNRDFPMMLHGGFGVAFDAIGLLLSLLVIYGALRMKNLENYGLALASAIVALVPCISPCCLLGLPFGIWAIVVLSDANVKMAFRS